eukprot:CAMPEP_0115355826 /NCGR_PEP_ID=MMETSP0270-20121206/99297_1 /TAXON_ID=71861 /ORGANISM="Scrippsiella trochoidea, Strain CCMP3099" /LENGTH=176 /DNA_ID=CAMNT_0002778193 /DNA_START=293 /DNA_END=824 /DNA_ORIENTATION=-
MRLHQVALAGHSDSKARPPHPLRVFPIAGAEAKLFFIISAVNALQLPVLVKECPSAVPFVSRADRIVPQEVQVDLPTPLDASKKGLTNTPKGDELATALLRQKGVLRDTTEDFVHQDRSPVLVVPWNSDGHSIKLQIAQLLRRLRVADLCNCLELGSQALRVPADEQIEELREGVK